MSARGFMPATVRAIAFDTDDSRVLELATDARITWRSGQHVSLRISVGSGIDIYRTYSICEPAASGAIKLGVRLLPNGVFSDWLRRCKVGDEVALSRPQGRFYLRPPHAPHARNLFIAAGSGITPVVSMVEEFLAAHAEAGALLLYANRSIASTMFLERLLQLKNRFMARFELHLFTSREQQAVTWRNARIDFDALNRLRDNGLLRVDDFARCYLCGPPPMMQSCARFLRDAGVSGARIHDEVFAPAQQLDALAPAASHQPAGDAADAADATVARVSVIINGNRRAFDFRADDASVLAAAARHRIALPFACTDGVCGTCRCKILSGTVTLTQNHALESADLDAGFTLACQARPLDDALEVSFDY